MIILILHFNWDLGNKIEQRKEKDPDKVDQMPVKTPVFKKNKVSGINFLSGN